MMPLNVVMDMTHNKYLEIFGSDKVDESFLDKIIWLKVNGKEIKLKPTEYREKGDYLNMYVRVSLAPYQSKEEIAAEESVTKAKEALKAAENALKIVKEGK